MDTRFENLKQTAAQFEKGEINGAEYSARSGAMGTYAQKIDGCMLRLRATGGSMSCDKLEAVYELCKEFGAEFVHFTSCQTIQLHNIQPAHIAQAAEKAASLGLPTLGGGGDYPRNVMASPLSGVDINEYFDVTPYAQKAAEYLISQIGKVRLPRKLKTAFCSNDTNEVHASFRDLGFCARSDGKFNVYICGGVGPNPKMGVLVGEGIDGSDVLYFVSAMLKFFCAYGNYDNRARSRTRYIQETLKDEFKTRFNECLKAAYEHENLKINVTAPVYEKTGTGAMCRNPRAIAQKQSGLYAVHFYPKGGIMLPEDVKNLYKAAADIKDGQLRISTDGTAYIINCRADEAERVIKATELGQKSSGSFACIGAAVCRRGICDSQEMLRKISERVKDLPISAVPHMRISGCPSSCSAPQASQIGMSGRIKDQDGVRKHAFAVMLGGCEKRGRERFAENVGVMTADDAAEFVHEVSRLAARCGVSYSELEETRFDEIVNIAKKYV